MLFFKQKTAYEMRISDWSSDVCSSDLEGVAVDLELVLAVDVSLSIGAGEARLEREGYVSAFRDPQVLDAIKGGIPGRMAVTYFEWASSAHTQRGVRWMLIDSEAAAAAFAMALAERRPGPAHYTSISGAIDFAATLFDDNGFEGTDRKSTRLNSSH